MMTEEDIIKKCGKETPFNVPEGYFEQLPQRIMERLDKGETESGAVTISLWQRVKPWLYMAAMFTGMIAVAEVFLNNPSLLTEQEVSATATIGNEPYTDEEIATMMEYAMVDDYTLYRYLTESE